MKKKKKLKIGIILFSAFLALLLLVFSIAALVHHVKVQKLSENYSELYGNPKYALPVKTTYIETVKADYSSAYAVIEMLSSWKNGKVTEEFLMEKNGIVMGNTSKGFHEELTLCFLPEYEVEMKTYVSEKEYLETVYQSLQKGIPVPIEWASRKGEKWSHEFALIVKMDVSKDRITLLNPSGYEEELEFEIFFERTEFKDCSSLPLHVKLGFYFGIYNKNTLFLLKEKTK